MTYSATLWRLDSLLQSVDSTIRDLLLSEDDPFALAMYFWVTRQHDIQLLHAHDLQVWCSRWVSRVLVDQEVSPRADDDIAAAALIAVSLTHDGLSDPERHEMLRGLEELLSRTSSPNEIPLGQPAYGAVVSLAALRLGADPSDWVAITSRIAETYLKSIRSNLAFGISFAIALLQSANCGDYLLMFKEAIAAELTGTRSGYEQQLYLVQAMMLLEASTSISPELADTAFQITTDSRVWSHLMVGTEDMPTVGSRDAPARVSNLYRVSLLDVMVQLQRGASQQAEAALIGLFQGRRIVGIAAFGFSVVVVTAIWWALLELLLVPNAGSAHQYWVQNKYDAMSRSFAAAYLVGIAASTLLLPWTLVFVWTTWKLLAIANVESDRYIFDVVWRRSRTVFIGWCVLFAIGLISSLFSNSVTNAFIHTIGGN